MVWVATAIIGGAVISTIGSSIAAGKAAGAATDAATVQASAANNAAAIQASMYGQIRNDSLPFQNVGRSAISTINSLIPGGLGTNNAAGPSQFSLTGGVSSDGTQNSFSGATGGAPAAGTPAGDGTIPVNAGGAAGGAPAAGAGPVPAGGSGSPFLNAQLANIPQNGTAAQAALAGFLPGSAAPNALLGAANNSILGGSGSPNAALSNLTSYIPGGSNGSVVGGIGTALGGTSAALSGVSPAVNAVTNSLNGVNSALNTTNNGFGGINSSLAGSAASLGGVSNSLATYNSLLGLGPSPFATSQLKGINDSYNADRTKWLKDNPGKDDSDWAQTDQSKGYNDKLIKFYQNNPDQAASGIAQATSQLNDPNFGDSAKARLSALQDIKPQTQQEAQANALAATPGYAFALDQGLKATQNGFAAQGLASSGAAMKGAAQYAEGLANTTYNQQLQNYLGNVNANVSGLNANVGNVNANLGAYNAALGNVNANVAGTGAATQGVNANLGAVNANLGNVNANVNNYQAQTGNAVNTYNATTPNALAAFNSQSNLAYNTTNASANNANTGYQGQVTNAQNLLNLGSNAAVQTGTQGTALATGAGNNLTSGAAATAGGIVGSNNAVNNGLISGANNIGGLATLYGLSPSTFGGGGTGTNTQLGNQIFNAGGIPLA